MEFVWKALGLIYKLILYAVNESSNAIGEATEIVEVENSEGEREIKPKGFVKETDKYYDDPW